MTERAILDIVVSGTERSVTGLQRIASAVSDVTSASRSLISHASQSARGRSPVTATADASMPTPNTRLMSKIGDTFRRVMPSMDSFKSALSGLIPPITGVNAVLEGTRLGLNIYDMAMGRNQEVMRRQIVAIQNETQARIQAQQAAASGDWEGLIQSTRALEVELRNLQQQQQDLIQTAKQQTGIGDQINTILGYYSNALLTQIDGIERMTTVHGQAGEELQNVNQRIAQITEQIRANERAFTEAQMRGNVVAAEQAILNARQEAIQVTRQLAVNELQMARDYERQRTVEQRQQQRDDLLSERQHRRDLARMARDYQRQLEDMARQDARAMRDLRRQEGREDYVARRQLSRSLFFMQRDFDRSLIDQARNRNRQLAREAAAYARERLRMEQDLNRTLFDAELENNAVAALQAQRDAAIQRQRADEDRALRLREEQEDYEWQLSEQRLQLERQRADLLEAYAIERADVAEQRRWQREDMRIAQADQREDAKRNYELMRADARYEYQLQRSDLLEQRQYERQINDENYRYQLDQLRYQSQLQLAELAIRERNALAVIQSGGQQSLEATRYWQLQTVSQYVRSLQAMHDATRIFASGGRPTYASAFSSFGNAVQQVQPQSSTAATNTQPVINFNSPISVGSGVSAQQVTSALTAMGSALIQAFFDARSGAPTSP